MSTTVYVQEKDPGAVITVDYEAQEGVMTKELSGLLIDPLGHTYEFLIPDNILGTKCVRLGWGGDIGFYLNPWPAEDRYDWDPLDKLLDRLAEKGYKILFTFAFTPKWLWPNDPRANDIPKKYFFQYYKIGYALPPVSYEKYEEMVYQTVRHLLIEKQYDIEFEGLNEANVPMFWQGSMEESFKFYEYIGRGVKRASPNAIVGGPTTAGFREDWLSAFIEYCAKHKVPLDFVSWHHYGKPKPYNLEEQTIKVREMISQYPELGNLPLYLTESSYDWRPESEIVQSAFHGAYMARSLSDMVNGGLDRFYYCGELGLLEAPNPASQTLRMFNMLDSTKIKAVVDGNENGTGVLATRNHKGINLLIWNLPELNEELPLNQNKVTLHLRNLPQGTYNYVRYLVDNNHMPGPMEMVKHQRLLMNVPKSMEFNSEQVTKLPITFELETYGVTLLQLDLEIKHSDNLDLEFRNNEKSQK